MKRMKQVMLSMPSNVVFSFFENIVSRSRQLLITAISKQHSMVASGAFPMGIFAPQMQKIMNEFVSQRHDYALYRRIIWPPVVDDCQGSRVADETSGYGGAEDMVEKRANAMLSLTKKDAQKMDNGAEVKT